MIIQFGGVAATLTIIHYQLSIVNSLRFLPAAALLNQIHEFLDGVFFGDVLLDRRLAFKQGNAAGATTYVAEVGVCHFARAVHDTAHDTNLQSYEILRGDLDLAMVS